jgi:anti-sigma B factor antagonist
VKIDVEEQPAGVYVVRLQGDMDMSTSPEVRRVMGPLWRAGTAQVIVDLAGVLYIDSSGIATFVEGLQLSHKGGIRFTLAGMTPAVEAVFELAYLRDVFDVTPRVSPGWSPGAPA